MNPESADEILNAFAVEPAHDQQTLQKYLRAHPDLTDDLLDLARELDRGVPALHRAVSKDEGDARDAAWRAHLAAAPAAEDRLGSLTVEEQREICRVLDIPRQVLSSLREHQVDVASIPAIFLNSLAPLLRWNVPALEQLLRLPAPSLGRSYKSEGKPDAASRVSFDELMRSCATEAQMAKWLPRKC